jgi:peptidase S41-like protein
MRFALLFSALLAIDWNADLDTLQREVPKLHANAFHATTKESFDSAIAKLRAAAPNLPPHLVAAEIARIVASLGDGHTRLTIPVDPNAGFFSGHTPTKLPDDPALRFHHLPVRFAWFADGLVITSAANKNLIGHRVARIGTKSVDEAVKAMAPLAAADNDGMRRMVIADFLAIPELLNAAGIAPSTDRVTVDGVVLDAVPFGAEVPWLAKSDPRPFWFEQHDRLVYFAFNEVANGEKETLAAFTERLFKFIDEHHIDALVIDLRANPGGNGALYKPLLHALIRAPRLRVFALIGPRTFSAATMFATALEQNTNAIFIGEPTGGSPNGFGDSRKLVLPSSGLTVRVATLYWQRSDPRDSRNSITPHLTVVPSSADFAAHRDLVMQSATHLADAMRKKGSLDGEWSGMITIDWKRIPVTMKDRRLTAPDLGVQGFAVDQPRFTIDSTEGALAFDLRVGDGVITGTLTANGIVFPVLLTRRASPAA